MSNRKATWGCRRVYSLHPCPRSQAPVPPPPGGPRPELSQGLATSTHQAESSGDVTLAGRRLSANRWRPMQARVHLRGHLASSPPPGGPTVTGGEGPLPHHTPHPPSEWSLLPRWAGPRGQVGTRVPCSRASPNPDLEPSPGLVLRKCPRGAGWWVWLSWSRGWGSEVPTPPAGSPESS